jgi:hypothetical protein
MVKVLKQKENNKKKVNFFSKLLSTIFFFFSFSCKPFKTHFSFIPQQITFCYFLNKKQQNSLPKNPFVNEATS